MHKILFPSSSRTLMRKSVYHPFKQLLLLLLVTVCDYRSHNKGTNLCFSISLLLYCWIMTITIDLLVCLVFLWPILELVVGIELCIGFIRCILVIFSAKVEHLNILTIVVIVVMVEAILVAGTAVRIIFAP